MKALVERALPGVRVTRCEVLKGGVSAEVQAVDLVRADGVEERVVVRRHREISGKAPAAERAAREHALLGVLHGRGVAVPRPRWFEPPDTLVQAYVEGSTTLPEDAAGPMAAALAAIHAIEIAELPELPRFDEPTDDLRTWLADPPGLDEAIGCVAPFSGPPVLLHGDFWPGNLMWRAGEIASILDWEDAAVGDALSDLACARVELACAAGVAVAEGFTSAYRTLRPVDEARLALWDLFVSSASLHHMDQWGLEPAVLEARRDMTRRWQAQALAQLRHPPGLRF